MDKGKAMLISTILSDSLPQFSNSKLSSMDYSFLEKLKNILETNFSNPELSNSYIADHLGISNRQLYRRVYQILEITPNQYITFFRMSKAKELLMSRQFFTVKEVALLVGYKKSSYFSKIFKEEFRETPLDLLRRIGVRQNNSEPDSSKD